MDSFLGARSGYLQGIFESKWGIGKSLVKLERYSEAKKYYDESISALEKIKGEIKEEKHKALFMEDKLEIYEELDALIKKLGN